MRIAGNLCGQLRGISTSRGRDAITSTLVAGQAHADRWQHWTSSPAPRWCGGSWSARARAANRLGQALAQLATLRALLVARGAAEKSAGAASCVRRSCLGKCSGEPLAHVMPDDVWYRALSGESLLRIYQRHVVN